ncbi:MAG: cation:proton antiporter [Myxococcota bacterium]
MPIAPLYLLTLIFAVGVAAQWLAVWTRLPALLLLLVSGLVLGPITGLVEPYKMFGDDGETIVRAFVQLAVALVLFEGGLTLHLSEARHVGATLWRLIIAGLVLGFALTTGAAYYIGGLSIETSACVGAILVVTGPTVIMPMLRTARIAMRPATLLKWEGIVNDPLGIMLAVVVLELILAFSDSTGASHSVWLMLLGIVGAGLLGAIVGMLLGNALAAGKIAEHLRSPIILASVLVVYALSDLGVHESGMLAVTTMGMVLAQRHDASLHDIHRFKEQISTLLVSLLFVVLSASLELSVLEALWGRPMLVVLAVLFVVRPLTVGAATLSTSLPWKERALVGWIAPRGVVAAAMAGAFGTVLVEKAEVPDGNLLMPIVFGVIMSTVVLHGLTIRPLARYLGLAAREGNGILIVGASRWAVSLAQILDKAGAKAVLADNRYRRVSRARMEGLSVHYGDVLHEDLSMELPMEQVSWVLAATDEDPYNSLVCMHFVHELGRERMIQTTPVQAEGNREAPGRILGKTPWGSDGSHDAITRRFWEGAAFKMTTTSAEFTYQDLQAKHPSALMLLYLFQERIGVLDGQTEPPIGAKVIFLS